jgi:hypothetical protein
MAHRNARLTVHGRRLLIERIRAGRPIVHVAAEMGISRTTTAKWVHRWRTEGEPGLHDRSSRPHTTPHRTPAAVEARVCALRTTRRIGPACIGPILGLAPLHGAPDPDPPRSAPADWRYPVIVDTLIIGS